jgi:uncharacterized membrane protein YeaQ/YmgE (transglycosylase-associated protein family)
MSLAAAKLTLRSRRFWIWQLAGAAIYAIPAIIRLATGNVALPLLSLLEIPWIGHWIPGNLVEKILVNMVFPGAAGAVAAEVYFQNKNPDMQLARIRKYLNRLVGAMVWVTLWSLFQLWGNLQNIMGTYGGNLFEYPMVYPLNYIIAAFSIFTPTVASFFWGKIQRNIKT